MTSTFLRQAFLPLRLACLYCAGAAPESAIVSFTLLCWRVVGLLVVAKSSTQNSDQRAHGLPGQDPPRTPALLGSRCWPPRVRRPVRPALLFRHRTPPRYRSPGLDTCLYAQSFAFSYSSVAPRTQPSIWRKQRIRIRSRSSSEVSSAASLYRYTNSPQARILG